MQTYTLFWAVSSKILRTYAYLMVAEVSLKSKQRYLKKLDCTCRDSELNLKSSRTDERL